MRRIAFMGAVLALAGCSTAPITGRSQLMLVEPETIQGQAAKAYYSGLSPYQGRQQLDTDPVLKARVDRITTRVIREAVKFAPESANWDWEVHVIHDKTINAYCAPGGKMAIYTGLVEGLQLTDDEVGVVMGHEIGHAIANHGAEAYSAKVGVGVVVAVLLGSQKRVGAAEAALAGSASSLLVTMPHSRMQETEADRIGIHLAALAGYDPEAAVTVFEKMGRANGGGQIEFFSDHPSDESRIASMRELLSEERPIYQAAVEQRLRDERPPPAPEPEVMPVAEKRRQAKARAAVAQ